MRARTFPQLDLSGRRGRRRETSDLPTPGSELRLRLGPPTPPCAHTVPLVRDPGVLAAPAPPPSPPSCPRSSTLALLREGPRLARSPDSRGNTSFLGARRGPGSIGLLLKAVVIHRSQEPILTTGRALSLRSPAAPNWPHPTPQSPQAAFLFRAQGCRAPRSPSSLFSYSCEWTTELGPPGRPLSRDSLEGLTEPPEAVILVVAAHYSGTGSISKCKRYRGQGPGETTWKLLVSPSQWSQMGRARFSQQ